MKLNKKTAFLMLALGVTGASAVSACSADGVESDGVPGTVGLELTLPSGAILSTVSYVATGPNGFTKTGTVDVSNSTGISVQLSVPAGGPYTITLNGTTVDGGTTCTGSNTFSVTAGQTTNVTVAMSCVEPQTTGSVLVNGALNFCPVIDGIEASPAEVNVTKTLSLSAAAHDGDGAPSPLTYAWSASTGGALSSATAANPTLTCNRAGNVSVTLTVSDGDTTPGCAKTQVTTVTCSNAPQLVPVAAGVKLKTLITVGDSVNIKPDGVTPYRLVGLPDGLGAYDNNDGTFSLLVNHEISSGGAVRAHGANGAFVSRWKVRKGDLKVLNGEDLIQTVARWDVATSSYLPPATGGPAFSRFCSADLPALSAYYDAASGLGFNGQLFMNGEESGNEGKVWAHGLDGATWELPRLGKASWENVVANPGTGVKTVSIGLDDTTPGQLYLYIGDKTNTGSPIQKAGLTNGALFGIAVAGIGTETTATGVPTGTAFTLASLGNVENKTGGVIDSESTTAGVTRWQRPEDGQWDPAHPADFYFVTTSSFTTPSRLYRLRFTDIDNLAAGGTVDQLLDGTEGGKMYDNITVDTKGHVYLQEDVGGQAHIGKVYRYDVATDALVLVAQHNPELFTSAAPAFLTIDEESSGIIDASSLIGPGWFLLDVQAHYNPGDAELVDGGQLLAMFDPAAL
jgi:hypothetical protein